VRPQFHFTAERGWINDPHGITARDGEYHAFFQYVPDSTVWAPNCHWGHARGTDLFSLQELPVALAPGEGDDGIWTGSLVTDDSGAARIFYTSTAHPDFGIGRIREARPADDGWIDWLKGDFVADAPSELDVLVYRDPFVIKEPGGWRMFVGAGLADGTAAALSYRSADLDAWEYEGIAAQRSVGEREPVWMGSLWECPQIVELDGRHVLISSVWEDDVLHYAGYGVGRYSDGRFEADTWGRLTYGPSYYAPSFFRDAEGRPCLTFWMRGVADLEAGWASAHSVPHVLRLEGDTLIAAPHPGLAEYRRAPVADGGLPGLAGDVIWAAEPGQELVVADGQSDQFVVAAEAGMLRLRDGASSWDLPWGGGEVRVVLDAQAVEVSTRDGVLGIAASPVGRAYFVRAGGGELTVRPLER
jgi:beta-fructofuranosidase